MVYFTLFRYEFFEKIDLSSFLEESRQTQATYTLHAVLVHSGKYKVLKCLLSLCCPAKRIRIDALLFSIGK